MLTQAWTPLGPHRLQSKLWRTTAKFPIVVAGRGSGKSEIAKRKIVRMLPVIKPWHDPNYFYGLPTYGQAKRVAWDHVNALIPQDWTPNANDRNKSELCISTRFGSKLYVVGLDKPQRIEGIQIDGCVIDECSDQHPGTYARTVLPMLTHRDGWCMRIGVPKRNGVGASEFKAAFEAGLEPNRYGIESYTWPSDTVLTPDQLMEVMGQLSSKDALEQLGGLWVAGEGQIFYGYDDTLNVDSSAIYHGDMRIGVGCDFNVNPMAWVLFHVINGEVHVFDELWIRNTNTAATLTELFTRYGSIHKAGWRFFGDASAKARKTSAAITDYIQIVNDNRFYGIKDVHFPDANPAVQDRFSVTNAMLLSALGKRRVKINPRCKFLRNDLQTRSYKVVNDRTTREPNDVGDIGHITDALGYPLCILFPMFAAMPPEKVTYTGQVANTNDPLMRLFV